MDLSDYLKLDLQDFYKSQGQVFGKRNTTDVKSQNLKNQRKDIRNKLVCEKRHINMDNLSPYVTPGPLNKTTNKNKPNNNKRYEMLLKWKEEKLKKQLEQKSKAKPIFKVMHVSTEVGLPQLDNVNKVIKGKLIKKEDQNKKKSLSVKNQFAPQNYKFEGPKNVVPINIRSSTRREPKVIDKSTSKKSNEKNSMPEKKLNKVTVKIDEFVTPKKKPKIYKKTPAIVRNVKQNVGNSKDKENIHINHNINEYDLRNRKVAICTQIKGTRKLNKVKETTIEKANVQLKEKPLIINSNKAVIEETDTKSASSSSLSTDYSVGECKDSTRNMTPKDESSPTKSKLVTYISPFVTINRGKDSARKEFISRKSKGGLYDSSPDIENNTGPKAGAAYFHRLLSREITRIENLCNEWNLYKEEQKPPEEACDMINVAIGQSQLLIQKKFKQFSSLIDACESGNSDMPITCEDLHGYWDTAYIQVGNLNMRFDNLNKLRSNNWEEIVPHKKTTNKRNAEVSKPKVQASSRIRDAIKAARDKAKAKMNIHVNQEGKVEDTFNDDFCPVISPSKPTSSASRTPAKKRKSLLIDVLTSQGLKRESSPGLVMLKATQIAKSIEKDCGDTPSKSILKTQLSKSNKKRAKSVLFKEEYVNEVPVGKLISFTDSEEDTPRKYSMRLRGQKLF